MQIVIDIPEDELTDEEIQNCIKIAKSNFKYVKTIPNHGRLIDADALIERYKDSPVKIGQEQIETMPSVQQKTGCWIRQTDDYHDYYECEYCGIAVGLDDIKNYCPNCGAKMEVEE